MIVEFFIHLLQMCSKMTPSIVPHEQRKLRRIIARAQLCLIRHSQPALRGTRREWYIFVCEDRLLLQNWYVRSIRKRLANFSIRLNTRLSVPISIH